MTEDVKRVLKTEDETGQKIEGRDMTVLKLEEGLKELMIEDRGMIVQIMKEEQIGEDMTAQKIEELKRKTKGEDPRREDNQVETREI